VKSLCQRALFLKDGEVIANDKADVVVEEYFARRIAGEQVVIKNSDSRERLSELEISGRQKSDLRLTAFRNHEQFMRRAAFQRIRNGKADFANVQLLDNAHSEIKSVEYGQEVVLRMSIIVYEDIHMLSCGYHIQNRNGISIVNSNLSIEDKKIMHPEKGNRYCIDWSFKVALMEGIYNVACVLSIPLNAEFDEVDFCDYVPCALQFEMQKRARSRLYGHVHWDNIVEITAV
jgi:lipopolysaccharide transport system ATP-binding protein